MKAIIAAGGKGTRLYPLTFTSNKHMLPIANKPMLLYPFESIVSLGIKEIGIIVNNSRPDIEKLIGDGSDWGVKVTYIDQPVAKGLAHVVQISEKFIDGDFVGVGEIKSAYFQHRKNDFYAFYYEQNGDGEYFDEEGASLRKAFYKSPLKFGRMTSSYSKRRFHPVLHKFKSHLGTDYAAPTGTPIHSTGDGIVIEAKYKRNNGNYVKIRHNGTFMTQYLHMSKIANGIRPGVAVKQDQIIGYVGMTGLATGPHVCYRFWKNGEQVNHRAEKIKSSNPIPDESLSKYKLYIDSIKSVLDSIKIIKNIEVKDSVLN